MAVLLSWHRRHALMLASQLPENSADARLVIQAVTELLDTFMTDTADTDRPSNVVAFGSPQPSTV
ncbi:hypothetical protein [Bradyrhizobium erythrophlei]|uniref:Uncharacterized protein n=1 Tax=Bradyrhizobium erythrophlei TaxID=1437360 RepID=A0A1M5UI25_9BRAD|nr:hypothetical protein [Bradyrhizobium erythrophlei]SHH62732.1 hypothetical protein SAMN05443248_5457 [Bradyrhizobium erythrophlei]